MHLQKKKGTVDNSAGDVIGIYKYKLLAIAKKCFFLNAYKRKDINYLVTPLFSETITGKKKHSQILLRKYNYVLSFFFIMRVYLFKCCKSLLSVKKELIISEYFNLIQIDEACI